MNTSVKQTQNMKKLFQLEGFVTKSKQTMDIYCIAVSELDAIKECSSFATGLVVKKNYQLGKDWD